MLKCKLRPFLPFKQQDILTNNSNAISCFLHEQFATILWFSKQKCIAVHWISAFMAACQGE